MKVKLLRKGKLPFRGTPHSAGLDIYCTEDVTIPPLSSVVIPSGVCLEVPEGCFGLLTHRSSLNIKQSLVIPDGTVDSDYRGEIKVKVYNLSERNQTIREGDRFAQLIVIPFKTETLELVETLEDTERGDNGFGSTGTGQGDATFSGTGEGVDGVGLRGSSGRDGEPNTEEAEGNSGAKGAKEAPVEEATSESVHPKQRKKRERIL